MFTKKIMSLFICAAVLTAAMPASAFAQTLDQAASRHNKHIADDAPTEPRADLKAAFEKALSKSRAHTITEEDLKRLENEAAKAQFTPKHSWGSKKEKILIISVVAGLVVLAVVLALKTGKGGHNFCSLDPTDPDCLPG